MEKRIYKENIPEYQSTNKIVEQIENIYFELLGLVFFRLNNFIPKKLFFYMKNNNNNNDFKNNINFLYKFLNELHRCYTFKEYENIKRMLSLNKSLFMNKFKNDKPKLKPKEIKRNLDNNGFSKLFNSGLRQFINYYKKKIEYLLNKYEEINTILDRGKTNNNNDTEKISKIISEIFLPELNISEKDILSKWKLKIIKKNNNYLKPTDFIIQLNGLYTLNNNSSFNEILSERSNKKGNNGLDRDRISKLNDLFEKYRKIEKHPGEKIGVYDHPVEIFCKKEKHELLNFLEEFDKDIEFEKLQKVFPVDYKIPVVISLSTTYKNLESIVSEWVKFEIENLNLKNISVFLLDNQTIEKIKKEILENNNTKFNKFTVEGNYANHFNALKYIQLLFEKGFNKKAGFKLDTDEGIKSKELFALTSKTWFQTLCSDCIGSVAENINGKVFKLSFIVGEYINNSDIIKNGYKNAFFEPDVKKPLSYFNNMLFFNKGFAHAKATYIYNKYSKKNFNKIQNQKNNNLNNIFSHPVVKGGGYGIENEGLKQYIPFCPSFITRAEDQAFYYSGVCKGLKGVFIETLRIAHYKEKYSQSEKKTTLDRLIEDMHRLIVFSQLNKFLDNKSDLDPLPGVFISNFPFSQAFLTIIYNTLMLISKKNIEQGVYLYEKGLNRLNELYDFISLNKLEEIYRKEEQHWGKFALTVDKLDKNKVKKFLESCFV